MKAQAPGRGVLALTLLALLAVVAATSRTRLFHEGAPPLSANAARLAGDFFAYLLLALLLIGLAVVLWALWPSEYDGPQAPRRPLRSLLLQMLASACVLAVVLGGLLELRMSRAQQASLPAGAAAGAAPPSILGSARGGAPAAFDWAAAGLVAATALVAAAIVWLRLRRARRTAAERRALARALEEVVADTLDDLRLDADPRRAVIQAYARFERVLRVHGLPRRAPEAPLEYVARALNELEVPGPATARLTDLFEVARFSRHEVSSEMRDEAVGCLLQVRAALAG